MKETSTVKSMKCLVSEELKEYLTTEEHQLGILLDTEAVIEIGIDETQYTNLRGINCVIFTMRERKIEGFQKSLGELTGRDTELLFRDSLTLYVDASFDYRKMAIRSCGPAYYINTNKHNVKEVTLHTGFKGGLAGTLDGIGITATTYVQDDKLRSQVHTLSIMGEGMGREICNIDLSVYTNLEKIVIKVINSDGLYECFAYLGELAVYTALLRDNYNVHFCMSYYSKELNILDVFIAALTLGTVEYTETNVGKYGRHRVVVCAGDSAIFSKYEQKCKNNPTYRVDTMENLAVSYFAAQDKREEQELIYAMNRVDYWKKKQKECLHPVIG